MKTTPYTGVPRAGNLREKTIRLMKQILAALHLLHVFTRPHVNYSKGRGFGSMKADLTNMLKKHRSYTGDSQERRLSIVYYYHYYRKQEIFLCANDSFSHYFICLFGPKAGRRY